MGTGWRLRDQHGREYDTWMAAVNAYQDDSNLTFTEVTLSMAGTHERDVTDEVRRRLATRNAEVRHWLR